MSRMKRRSIYIINLVWKREYTYGIIIFILLGFFYGWTAGRPAVKTTKLLPSAISGKTIVIDAGHGGIDPGAVGRSGLKEKEVTLDIAKRLKRYFSRVGVYVVMTREADLDYSGESGEGKLTKKRRDILHRVKIANESEADLLLSIHVNSFPQSIWSGAQCFYDRKVPESKLLAVAIQKSMAERLGPNRRKAQQADYLLLEETTMPAVTVEVGFISNPREEALLADEEYREKLAEAIFYGTVEYLSALESEARPVLTGKVYPELTFPPVTPGTVCLYYATPNNEDLMLTPEIREMPTLTKWKPEEKGVLVLAELLKGPGEGSALLPCLPPGEWVRSFRLGGETAVVDIDPALAERIDGGGASEMMALYSLVNTLAINLNLDAVSILVGGEKNATLGGHIFLAEAVKPRPELSVGEREANR